MFTSIYFYKVPRQNVEAFLVIQKRASKIYMRFGAIDDWTFAPADLSERYGCRSFLKEIEIDPGEALFFSLSLFSSKDEHDRIMSHVDKDPEIEILFKEVSGLIEISKTLRGEFNRVV
ncbi:MAG: DUF1428 family protein [Bdellovibrionales bacterium]|nr:DUF1428 family protein [Bdellovibrionales bacterium]